MSTNVLPKFSISLKSVLESADLYRLDANRKLSPEMKSIMGQFMTPAPIARYMASLFDETTHDELRILDAGAGVGSLTAALIERICQNSIKPSNITSVTYEFEPQLLQYLTNVMTECQYYCEDSGIEFNAEINQADFIETGARLLKKDLFSKSPDLFNLAILNPPYKKIRSDSEHRQLLRSIGIETSNLYSAFLAIAIALLEPGGELVAITPRSFCNGPYFKPFRKLFLKQMSIRKIHIFESRDTAFSDDDVLQENIIFHAVKGGERGLVRISASSGPDANDLTYCDIDYDSLIKPDDPDLVIHVAASGHDQDISNRIQAFDSTLEELGIEVSTGRIVDFRAKEFIKKLPETKTVPLIYPVHFDNGYVKWPNFETKKPNAIISDSTTEPLLLPSGYYVLVKRFSAKEERRRITAAIYDPEKVISKQVGFENHLNVYHFKNTGLSPEIAKGLAVYLNSTLVDLFFRQFSGHTQVNASDLRSLRYPNLKILESLGKNVKDKLPSQEFIDNLMDKELKNMIDTKHENPVKAKQKIKEALEILKELGLPIAQQNERSALTLLALLDIKPDTSWHKASAPLMGITPIMDFARDFYGRAYAPNTRETFRRFTMHQFVEAGVAISNPDKPDRAVNSPKWVYQIEPKVLELIKTYNTPTWAKSLKQHLDLIGTLRERYARARKMIMLPVKLTNGAKIELTPGKHNELIKAIIEDFGPRFVPGGKILYAGDTGDKWSYCDEEALGNLGVTVDIHGKMPDVIIYFTEKNWLVLIEVVTSHGPVDSKRRNELAKLFSDSTAGLVYVTAFPSRNEMTRFLGAISWETEVWVADAPSHLIHFNGERFLGPYED